MCYFMEISISKIHQSLVDSFSHPQIVACCQRPTELKSHLPADFLTFTLLESGCSCNLYSGQSGKKSDNKKEHDKYKKKGWSDAKIARAFKQREDNQHFLRADVEQIFLDFLSKVEQFYVLIHWSDAEIADRKTISKAAFIEGNSLVLENEIVLIN